MAEKCPACGAKMQAWCFPSGRQGGWKCQCGFEAMDAVLAAIRAREREKVAEAVKGYRDLLAEYANSPAEFEDARMKYVTIQVDKSTRTAARALLEREP